MKKARTKCYIYTRVSTAMQVDGYSLDAQREKLRKYADYEDMVIAGEYSDEGFSGKNIQGRHEFQQMLRDVQDCKDGVSYVLVFKLSRFGRNAADVLNSLQLIERIDIFPEKQPDGNWIRNIVFAFPVPYNGKEIREFPLESQSTVECVLLMSKSQ